MVGMLKYSISNLLKRFKGIRLTKSATSQLDRVLEARAKEIVKAAVKRAKKENRRTITADDILYAKAVKKK